MANTIEDSAARAQPADEAHGLRSGAASDQRERHRHDPYHRQAQHGVQDHVPRHPAQRRTQQHGPEGHERHAVEQFAKLLVQAGDALGLLAEQRTEAQPGDEGGDEPDPPSGSAIPYARRPRRPG
jgi:hypothetical protein